MFLTPSAKGGMKAAAGAMDIVGELIENKQMREHRWRWELAQQKKAENADGEADSSEEEEDAESSEEDESSASGSKDCGQWRYGVKKGWLLNEQPREK